MPRYIDADAFCKSISEMVFTAKTDVAEGMRTILEDIMTFPSADVQKVKHGKWIPTCDIDGEVAYENCSVCGIQFRIEVVANCGTFCQHCGARMDGGENNEL